MGYRAQDSGLRAKDKTGQRVKENDFFSMCLAPWVLRHFLHTKCRRLTTLCSIYYFPALYKKTTWRKPHENSNKIL